MEQELGSFVLSTKVDTDGMEAGVKKLSYSLKRAVADVEKQTEKVSELKKRLFALESGELKIGGTEKARNDLEKVLAKIKELEAEADNLAKGKESIMSRAIVPDAGNKNALMEQYMNGNVARVDGKYYSNEDAAQLKEISERLFEIGREVDANNIKAEKMGASLKEAVGAATQAEIETTKTKLKDAITKLDGLKLKAEEAGNKLKSKMAESSGAASQVGKSIEKTGLRISRLASSALVFSAITKSFTLLRQSIGNVMMSDESFRQSLYQLQAAFWTAFAPIYSYVVPAVKTLVNWITSAVVAVGKFIAMLTGKSYNAMVQQGKALKNRADAYKESSKNAGKAAGASKKAAKATEKENKALEKQLAAFDELNILREDKDNGKSKDSSGDTGSAGGGVSADGGGGGAFNGLSDVTENITTTFAVIMGVVGGALIAIGLLLLFNGQIGWGIGFIIAGAATVGASIAEIGSLDIDFSTKLASIIAVASGLILALGIVLLLKGPKSAYPLALGMIISGAGVLAVTAAEIAADEIGGEVGTMLHGIIAVASAALLAIGLLILFCGKVSPLAIGLIVTGAVGLATEIGLNADAVKTSLQGWLGGIVAILSTALLVIGIILCVCGVVTPLSIGLIALGAVGLATEATLNWNTIQTKWDSLVNDMRDKVIGVGIALLVFGVALLASGAAIPLGLGLIAAGGVCLGKVIAANWSYLTDKVAEVWESVKNYWNNNIKKYFTAKWWGDLAKTAVNGFVKFFINGLNKLIRKINSFGFDMPEALGGKHIGFNIKEIQLPALARGAVIPPNRAFMAVLGDQKSGTNIEAPLATIEEAVRNVLSEGNYGGAQTIILQLDGREVGRTFGQAIQNEARRTGSSLVKPKIVFG